VQRRGIRCRAALNGQGALWLGGAPSGELKGRVLERGLEGKEGKGKKKERELERVFEGKNGIRIRK
jgi:hypothetical protein